MRILLVNSNPVVSRLTALSARKESVELDEIRDIDEFKEHNYEIVFVDLESYNSEILKMIKRLGVKRKVLFYSQDDRDIDDIFNYTILKPFLPSEVSAILREAKIEIDEEENSVVQVQEKRAEPKEEYLNLNELISTKSDDLTPIELEKKSENREEELLAELKASEEKIDRLKESFDLDIKEELPIINKREEKKSVEKKVEKREEIKLFELDEKDEISPNDNKSELFVLDEVESEKQENKLLKFDEESKNEITFENLLKSEKPKEEVKKEVVVEKKEEKSEIASISETEPVLEEKKSDKGDIGIKKIEDIEKEVEKIDDTSIALSTLNLSEEKEQKEEKEKPKARVEYNSETPKAVKRVFKDTVGLLPVEELRQLLRGTKIHITIEFPKEV